MEEEDGPILIARMCLVRQHQLGQHVFVTGNGDGELVLHDGTTVNVERRDEDILDMVLGGFARVLGTQLSGGLGHGVSPRQDGQG